MLYISVSACINRNDLKMEKRLVTVIVLLSAILCGAQNEETTGEASETSNIRATMDTDGNDTINITADEMDVDQEDSVIDNQERFVCRPHITIQTPPVPAPISRAGQCDCNCNSSSSSRRSEDAVNAQEEKQSESLARQLRELVQECRSGGGGAGGGGGGGLDGGWRRAGAQDETRRLAEALVDLATVLKNFQTPGVPVPGIYSLLVCQCFSH